ncbi:rhamnogalacturonidase [Flavisolibacter ginsenosidimutans]|uniref:Glycoside hydrolase family 28 protein n=1 Tax=Flavisolibacter ginsenosidimutans TaxID=661481 RepID=A0A5B8UHK6_9BACT|nr:glycoside hydrolase family 28 protein [Flavisolibacter ginsenosidimutans]QEC56131.1 glycoside hydrolase family 28 protein [Flavisolibacter ginsenosidimutans]
MIKNARFFLLLLSIGYSILSLAQTKSFYNVKELGAKGNGTTSDTKAVNKVIEDAAAAGGGTIYFPAGNYLLGSVRLKSNICLFIEQGATLIASSDSTEFDKPEPSVNDTYQDYGHSHWQNSFIWGEKLHDVSIIGNGLIWGKGLVRSGKKGDQKPNKAISLLLCRNVTIKDVSILHGGWFAILATGVDNLTLDNLKVDTNRDGFDIDCCKNVRVSNCTVNSPFDDGICLKSSFGLGYAKPTENVTITNCQVSGYDEGTLLDGTFKREYKRYSDSSATGRIKFGTESNGGFKNITITNCVFEYCRGLALETVDGALLEDVTISNLTMRDILNAPIFIRLGARMRGPDTIPVGKCRRIIIENVVAWNVDARQGALISGLPGHDIEDLQLSNIKIYYKGGGLKDSVNRVVPEYEKDYPEPGRWRVLPSYGFYVRHVKNLKLTDVEVSYMNEDGRPPFILDDVKGAELRYIKAQKAPGASTVVLKNVKDVSIQQVRGLKDAMIQSADRKDL